MVTFALPPSSILVLSHVPNRQVWDRCRCWLDRPTSHSSGKERRGEDTQQHSLMTDRDRGGMKIAISYHNGEKGGGRRRRGRGGRGGEEAADERGRGAGDAKQ